MAEYKAGPKLEQIQIPSDMREKFTVNDLPEISDEYQKKLAKLEIKTYSPYGDI